MDFCKTAYKVIAAVFLLGGTPAMAVVPLPLEPLTLNARYIISWSGITIGRILITAREDGSSYSLSLDTKTHGAGSVVSDEASIVAAEGIKNAKGDYLPVQYRSAPQGKKSGNVTTLTYDADGKISQRTREPEDDPNWRPPVPVDEANTAHDPITASFLLRRELYQVLENPDAVVSTRTYDGAKLAEMKMTRNPDSKLEVMDKPMDSVNMTVTRTPIDGYTPKELKKFKKGDPEIHLYFSNDAAFLPIRASAKLLLGELSLTMTNANN